MKKIYVYLDTQDYSRFGRVVEGRGREEDKKIYEELLAIKEDGQVNFLYSMPILGELLQFDCEYAETSFAKAEAIERLCNGNALAYISDLIAFEISQIALEKGIITSTSCASPISGTNGWFPKTPDVLLQGKEEVKEKAQSYIASLNRVQRRKDKRFGIENVYSAIAQDAAAPMYKKYGIPQSIAEKVLRDYWMDRMTVEAATEALFESVIKPRNFCQVYFQGYDGDKSLPRWVADFGLKSQEILANIRNHVAENISEEVDKKHVIKILSASFVSLTRTMLTLETDDKNGFGLSSHIYEIFRRDNKLASEITSIRVVGAILSEYIFRTSGLRAQTLDTERGFGGDLIHAIYLSHVDLWRTDRRFSDLVIHTLPEFKERVVSRITDLPEAIRRALATKAE